ncbi:MAG: fumarylacetoacetate hydrolase family protein [Pyrinomonadaceae bacterium]|nr:fumarylacetoacetate hydrolase family protein [Pyrinomonadaceae bacterium]
MYQQICRFICDSSPVPQYGLVEKNLIFPISEAVVFGGYPDGFEKSGDRHEKDFFEISAVRILPPANPTKIVCVGRNYRAHAAELGNEVPSEPLLFLKPPSSVIGSGDIIELPSESNRVDFEGELAAVIGRKLSRNNSSSNILDNVLGYTCLNDVTARDLQKKDVQFTRGKSFDTFCPFGRFLTIGVSPENLRLTTRVNGEIKQDGNTNQMIFPIPELLTYISGIMTLLPGDIIATGTPAGVGELKHGDTVSIEIENVGVLSNPVANR